MTRYSLQAAPCVATLMLLALSGCHRQNTSVPPSNGSTTPPNISGPEQPAVKTPIKDAVQQMLTQQQKRTYSPIPKGTRLLSVNLKDGVATLDFSKEFGKLADMGESTESKALKLVQRTLAPIQGVEQVSVTVEGRPFEGQTDWDHLPVRNQEEPQASGAESNDNGGESR